MEAFQQSQASGAGLAAKEEQNRVELFEKLSSFIKRTTLLAHIDLHHLVSSPSTQDELCAHSVLEFARSELC
jgi:hypothetical protein